MNLGLTRPDAVVSLNHVATLDYVSDDGDVLAYEALNLADDNGGLFIHAIP